MFDLDWIREKQLCRKVENGVQSTIVLDNLGIERTIAFIQKINHTDNMSFPDKPNSLARYSRYGLAITPTYLTSRGNNRAQRRRVHPLGVIQYMTTSLLLNGSTFSSLGTCVRCAKAEEADVFYGELCFYVKELENLRTVLPMDKHDTLNLSKVFDDKTLKEFPQFTMATDITLFEKLQATYVDKYIRPVYGGDTDPYTAFWKMMYYRTFVSCFNRYMPELLWLAEYKE